MAEAGEKFDDSCYIPHGDAIQYLVLTQFFRCKELNAENPFTYSSKVVENLASQLFDEGSESSQIRKFKKTNRSRATVIEEKANEPGQVHFYPPELERTPEYLKDRAAIVLLESYPFIEKVSEQTNVDLLGTTNTALYEYEIRIPTGRTAPYREFKGRLSWLVGFDADAVVAGIKKRYQDKLRIVKHPDSGQITVLRKSDELILRPATGSWDGRHCLPNTPQATQLLNGCHMNLYINWTENYAYLNERSLGYNVIPYTTTSNVTPMVYLDKADTRSWMYLYLNSIQIDEHLPSTDSFLQGVLLAMHKEFKDASEASKDQDSDD